MIVVFNVPALIIAVMCCLPCYLVFGLAVSSLIGRPDLTEFNFHLSTLVGLFAIDLLLRAGQAVPPLRRLLDPRVGGHLFFVPLWCWGLVGSLSILNKATGT